MTIQQYFNRNFSKYDTIQIFWQVYLCNIYINILMTIQQYFNRNIDEYNTIWQYFRKNIDTIQQQYFDK